MVVGFHPTQCSMFSIPHQQGKEFCTTKLGCIQHSQSLLVPEALCDTLDIQHLQGKATIRHLLRKGATIHNSYNTLLLETTLKTKMNRHLSSHLLNTQYTECTSSLTHNNTKISNKSVVTSQWLNHSISLPTSTAILHSTLINTQLVTKISSF